MRDERRRRRTREDNATQPLDAGRLSFAKIGVLQQTLATERYVSFFWVTLYMPDVA